jgi:hypothetical protein
LSRDGQNSGLVPDLDHRAYEIKYHWREEPPPPEIVENLTAKGGDIRKRTLENFHIPGSREPALLVEGVESAEDEQTTPKVGNTIEAEEAGSGGRYPSSKTILARLTKLASPRLHDPPQVNFYNGVACLKTTLSRLPLTPLLSNFVNISYTFCLEACLTLLIGQLRQDPKRTQLFQPDLGPTRRIFSRATNSPQASPAPQQQQHQQSSSTDPRNPNFSIDKYQPRHPMAMALRPVVTPGNDPEIFRQRVAAARANAFPKAGLEPQQALKHVPGGEFAPSRENFC